MQDFTAAACQPFDFPGGEHAVLLIHGFTGSPGHMRLIGEGLRDAGFTVRGIALPGHITTIEDMRKSTWQDWLRAVREAAQDMRKKYKHFSVAGLSMGGDLSLIMAQEMDLTACVPIAAPMRTTNKFLPLSLPASLFVPVQHKRIGTSRKMLDERYDYGYDSFPTKSSHDLAVLMRRARTHLPLITCPILAVQSRQDKTVSADSADVILGGVSSQKKAMLWLETSPHVCTIAPEYPKIVEAMITFLRDAEG